MEDQCVFGSNQSNGSLWVILTKDPQARHGSVHPVRIFLFPGLNRENLGIQVCIWKHVPKATSSCKGHGATGVLHKAV